jgi:glyceraldehyde 3-phosphate dehydrogenase
MRIAINGFGRIGRMVLRAIQESTPLNIVKINDPTSFDVSAHLYRYDSIHGKTTLKAENNSFDIGFGDIPYTSEKCVEKWGDVDLVLECSGYFTKNPSVHLEAGAKRVLVSAPSDAVDMTVVYGVNHKDIHPSYRILSNASCTTNCLAPLAYLLHEALGIEYGYMTTIHSYTGDQRLIDTGHSDLRRARAAALSMIPSTTGAAKAVGLVIPSLKGKLDGTAIRVPTANVSVVDFKFHAARKTTIEEINAVLRSTTLDGVLTCVDTPLVSTDFNHDRHSSSVDVTQTQVIEGRFCRVLSWYDNEWGFANRMCDVARYLSRF